MIALYHSEASPINALLIERARSIACHIKRLVSYSRCRRQPGGIARHTGRVGHERV
jgi:hypothetical protein